MKLLRNIACLVCSLAAVFVYAEDATEGEAQIVSSFNLTKWYNADGTAMDSNGGGGKGAPERIFDGNFTNYQMLPRCHNGGYFIMDFTSVIDGGYYITKILVGHAGGKRYSIYYTEDGTTWSAVPGATTVTHSGIATYELGKVATQIKYVFDDGSSWDYGTEYIAEVEVWGIDPFYLECTHPTYTDWVEVPNSATCLESGIMERFCEICGERFTMMSSTQTALNHNYVSTLVKAGKYVAYGSGHITCSRCDYYLDCSEPIDLITNKVNDAVIGGIAGAGKYYFTDVTVCSENNPQWGPAGFRILDSIWNTSAEWPYWASAALENQYVDYKFGTKIDLAWVDVSVHNRDQILQFYDLDVSTGTERFLGQIDVLYIPEVTNVVTNIVYRQQQVTQQATDENGEPMYDEYGSPIMEGVVDSNGNPVMENILDVHGNPLYDEVESISIQSVDYQRHQITFYEEQTSYLRVRILDEVGITIWGNTGVTLLELHPWGTVPGAGRPQYRKETLILMK